MNIMNWQAFLISTLFISWFPMAQAEIGCQENLFRKYLEYYDVKFYFLDLQVENLSAALSGSTSVFVELVEENADTLALELIEYAKVDSIRVDNRFSDFIHEKDYLLIPLSERYKKNDNIYIQVFYNCEFQTDPSNWKRGVFYETASNGKSVIWTLSEPFASKIWFPCKQVLEDKADSAYVYITTPDSLMAGANGILKQVKSLPGDRHRYEWQTNYPIAYYLLSFAVADYYDYSFKASIGGNDSILVQNYIYNDPVFLENNKENIDATANMLEVFSDAFGPYPFRDEKYGHCIVPTGGGMENQTMTTLGNFDFVLVAHELAHQWFGDNVTCSNWQDIWINEGFASYGEYIAIERLKVPEDAKSWLFETHSTVLDIDSGSVYIPENEIYNESRIFNYPLSYRKGASIIHMIRHEMGNDELFFSLLKVFQKKYTDSVAATEDFIRELEIISNRDFDDFFEQWYYGEGYPILDIQWKKVGDSLFIFSNQSVSAPEKTPLFNLLIDFRIEFMEGDTLVQFRQEKPSETFALYSNRNITRIIPDPDDWLIKKVRAVNRILPDKKKNFVLFPNPAMEEVYIENYNLGMPYHIKIFDMNGTFIHETYNSNPYTRINLSKLSMGVYHVVVDSAIHKQNFQLVKN